MAIPKLIHQTIASRREIHPTFTANIEFLKKTNPGWTHRLYDDSDILSFLAEHYGSDTVALFKSIHPSYGAARADFFRYHLMYKYGGVYLY